ncbi:glycosyltransferase family 2 protein [Roseofilum sp. BLCC_M91]|uniref:Glycosyltransferase family 2 protein n=1 Tax=Roseofilum halophilum BLCC-M91 TaxID=3022259 RepID=A0ABT7BPX5_9CYAN|nr:glycosyltransferase family 2 protein [Roseofilum halophilum]MDJ1181248.1 glycosyltransferase family 2 protein [Roseofilum halophilum BLCC-M91]
MKRNIGIVLATYYPNLEYLRKQIQSLQGQTWQDWVGYVVDDGSSQDCQIQIQEMIAEDPRFQFYPYSDNRGSYRNFERGLQLCVDDPSLGAIACCDQDDIWLPDKLERQWQALESQSALLVHSDLELIDAQDQTRHRSAWQFEKRAPQNLSPQLLLLRNTLTGCTIMFRPQLLWLLLPFPARNGGDWYHDWWIALIASHQGKIAHIPYPLVRYRIHETNTVGVVENAGTLSQEAIAAWQNLGKMTGRSYITHCNLNQAVCDRLSLTQDVANNPFGDRPLNFGLPILKLGWRSWQAGYGSQGIALRVFVHKCRKDVKRLLSRGGPSLPKDSQ